MPVSYGCDNCDATAASLDNWYTVAIGVFWDEPNLPPPGGRTSLNAQNPTLAFHAHECLDAWCQKAGIPTPPAKEAAVEPAGT